MPSYLNRQNGPILLERSWVSGDFDEAMRTPCLHGIVAQKKGGGDEARVGRYAQPDTASCRPSAAGLFTCT